MTASPLISTARTVAAVIAAGTCLLGCDTPTISDTDPAVRAANGQQPDSSADEPPFFVVDADATGPLTLLELNIHIPADIDKDLSNRQRKCFLARVEELAQEAGEPSDIDPDDFRYWGGNTSREDWLTLNREQQRTLLAQAIVTFGFQDCL